MPPLAAGEAELMTAAALDWLGLDVIDLDGVIAVRSCAPLHQTVALEDEKGNDLSKNNYCSSNIQHSPQYHG